MVSIGHERQQIRFKECTSLSTSHEAVFFFSSVLPVDYRTNDNNTFFLIRNRRNLKG